MTDTGWAAALGLRAGEHFVDVPPEDPRALRDAIESVISAGPEAAAMGGRAHELVAQRSSTDAQVAVLLDGLAAAS